MQHKLFYDTNALLNLQELAFKDFFCISQKTLEEIEHIKVSATKDNDIKYKARKCARLLDDYHGKYSVIVTTTDILEIISEKMLEVSPDTIILAAAFYQNSTTPLTVVSDDINVKCISREVFELATVGIIDILANQSTETYSGYTDVTLSDEKMSYFYTHQDENIFDCIINEYVIIRKSDQEIVDLLKWDGEHFKKVCNKTIKSTYFGDKIKPKDSYQAFVIDSILSNTMTAIAGKAGSGKSLLSLITIMNLIESEKYDRVVIMFNPTKAKGASDMGFYSGDAIEKAMQNSIGSILTTKFGDRLAVEFLLQQDKLKLVSMADIRGMEIRDNEILYITEAQNTSSELMKLCLSRASSGCKIIIEGDYSSQVDSYAFENMNNGMKRVIDVLKGESEFAYIELQNVWRSKIAALVDKL